MIYHTRDEHANHYTTDVVYPDCVIWLVLLMYIFAVILLYISIYIEQPEI